MSTVLIAGGSGLIGRRLSQLLLEQGHEVLHLSRQSRPDAAIPTYRWAPGEGYIDDDAVLRADYVINLAGAGIADKPWTKARKRLIIDSRVEGARLLLSAFGRLQHFPKAYISSAAIGYYGERGSQWVDERSAPGAGFLAESCVAWEDAIGEVARAGVRTVGIRIGIVLSTQGGAMEKMLLPFQFRLGTYFGDGRQWYSWIHIDDLCGIFIRAMEDDSIQGFYNGVAPNPVSNKALAEGLREALGNRAAIAPVPAFALRLAMGEMADVVLLSTRVSSKKIENAGFDFSFPNLKEALADLLQRRV
ncbi:MAG: TIGR01777 family oxidoreductase [Phaeodactylibacter sp.]|nr:TIGR01777 family oxidoreductase [Phaeodactylibacter sp.]MCB9051278.1 TIGR01777 family protein [Lewinellaceae bacterium]